MSCAIDIVGMACCYPDAHDPLQLWDNVLAERRAFRRLPPERLSLADYFSADPETPDAIYSTEAALIEGYEFDRVRFRVAGPIFRSVDLTHWLALDIADRALADAGFPGARGLPLESTGVLVGNTLAGEFSRAATLRLRWPYVRRVVDLRLRAEQWEDVRRRAFLRDLEDLYKAPFPPVGEETLAGALSNTIAGGICNYFHLGGGGYTVDGACCASLLGVARACSALEAGEIDAAVAGGVDLSLDPFELVGFSKAGALARGEMRIYDRQSTGFLPGEGCGFVVLLRSADVRALNLRSYGTIRGWGISSDGGGGITRPEIRGQVLALERAYRRSDYGVETVALFEGHGTGTPIGDEVELKALSAVRGAARGEHTSRAAIGSIKANIGHTKAAAGVAGLIKATLAVHHYLIPPTTGVLDPRPELSSKDAVLRALGEAEPWPESLPVRAGVSSFGFGGLNVHVTIEGNRGDRAATLSPRHRLLLGSAQDAELFLLDAGGPSQLVKSVERLAGLAPMLSNAELTDVAAALAGRLGPGRARAAVVAATPAGLTASLHTLRRLLEEGATRHLDPAEGVFLGVDAAKPRIVFLFPGQASPVRLTPALCGRRFADVRELYASADLPSSTDTTSTDVAQIAIIVAEVAGLRILNGLGIEASVAVGHSLGELAAYHWAGALDEQTLLALTRVRGRLMSELPGPAGAMASISTIGSEIQSLIAEHEPIVIACYNGRRQTVVSGASDAVARIVARARACGVAASLLPTAHAFHSPLMAPAAERLREAVAAIDVGSLRRQIVSTITGTDLLEDTNLRRLLVEQLTAPVRFAEAIARAESGADLLLEVGPGRILTDLRNEMSAIPAIALDVPGLSIRGVLHAVGAAYVLGASVHIERLFSDRFARPFDLDRRSRFFVNPCELAPVAAEIEDDPPAARSAHPPTDSTRIPATTSPTPAACGSDTAVQVIRELVSRRTELPRAAIPEDARLLRDLHLNSILVGEIVAEAARHLGVAPPGRLLEFADATIGEVAQALERLRASAEGRPPDREPVPAGVDAWCRAFVIDWVPRSRRRRAGALSSPGHWRVFGAPDHPWHERLSVTSLSGSGVIVCLSAAPLHEQTGLLLQGARAALHTDAPERYFVVTQPGSGSASFARTLHLEHPDILTRVIEAPLDSPVSEYIQEELSCASAHSECRYDGTGRRFEPCLNLLRNSEADGIPLQPGDVVLVSGGGKGIAAECALALARETGVRLVLLGRSRPEDDAHLADHLRKLAASDLDWKYIRTDVGDREAVRAVVRSVEQTHGPILGIVHGAGRNQPRLLKDLDEADIQQTLAPKVQGFLNLVSAVDAERLRLLVTFGSVIGRVGLRGQADYALANAALTCMTEAFGREHPACRCVALESSAWSGLGMAERLGRIEALRLDGIHAIALGEGISWFRQLVARKLPAVSVVVTGRLGADSPVRIDAPPLPLLRFVDRCRVHYPRVELVVDVDLTAGSDPYLLDHVFHGAPLWPAVVGLEAMVQTAMALTGDPRIPILEDVRFERPIVVDRCAHVTLRIAALARADRVEVAVRSSQTAFQVDHFRGFCRFTDWSPGPIDRVARSERSRLAIEPERDLYGDLLFHGGRFRRVAGYRLLGASFSCAEIAPAAHQPWFSTYLAQTLVLGDPAARDAAVHSIQACVPHRVLLPVAVNRVSAVPLNATEKLLAHARERWQDRDTYCYDLEMRTEDGLLRERWEGLQLRAVADAARSDWPDPLVATFLEWRVRELIPGTRVFAAFERDSAVDRRRRSERAIHRALDAPRPVRWRADGKPEVDAALAVSAAHADGLTLAVAGPAPVACDLEPVRDRPDHVWRDLLGLERWTLAKLIASQAHEDLQTSATRVWMAVESLTKAEAPQDAPLEFRSSPQDKQGWVSLAAPGVTIATSIIQSRHDQTPMGVAVLARSEPCATTSIAT
jgi:enediyne polyketide synthase